ncbi:MAG: hypothetical protein IKL65_01805 [Bacilli bacterium]|nr:hypothetical protein [Bacilli bacterium]
MVRKKIDLSEIKENDLDKTSSFTDLMSRSERRNRMLQKEKNITEVENNDIEDMVEERKRSTKDLTIELEKVKNEYNKQIEEKNDDELGKTQILELTRQMKFNFEETKKENSKNSKNKVTLLNIIGIANLLCIGYYIYLLVFTNYQDSEFNYMITGGIIVLLVLIFGLSVVTNKKTSKLFKILNILAILSFIIFNIYTITN